MQKTKLIDVAPEILAELVRIAADELGSVRIKANEAGAMRTLRFSPADVRQLVSGMVRSSLNTRYVERGLPQAMANLNLAARLTDLQQTFEAEEVTHEDILQLYKEHPGLLRYAPKSLEQKIRQVAKLVLAGDLKLRDVSLSHNMTQAVQTVIRNVNYCNLLTRNDSEIYARALLMRLGQLSFRDVHFLGNDKRMEKIQELLAGASTAKRAQYKELIDKAGIVILKPLSPDRRNLWQAALKARQTKSP